MIDDSDEDRPFCPSCKKAYSDHAGLVKTCKDLQDARSKCDILLNALIGLVGSSDVAELDVMEGVIRAANVPQSDKVSTINAIDAIRKTKHGMP